MKKLLISLLIILLILAVGIFAYSFIVGITPDTALNNLFWSDWKIIVAPTCEGEGLRERYHLFGDTETEVIPPLGHQDITISDRGGSCISDGLSIKECQICGYTRADKFEIANGHSYTASPIKEATCLTSGQDKLTCTACGSSVTAPRAALGHNYEPIDNYFVNEELHTLYKCSGCGDEVTVTGEEYISDEPTVERICDAEPDFSFRIYAECDYPSVLPDIIVYNRYYYGTDKQISGESIAPIVISRSEEGSNIYVITPTEAYRYDTP